MNEITVPKHQVMRMVKGISLLPDDAPITFEYVLTALFPTVFSNIQDALKELFTQGYLQGLKEKTEDQ